MCLVSLRALLNSGDDSVMVLTSHLRFAVEPCGVRSILIQVAEELLQHSPVCANDIAMRRTETRKFHIVGILPPECGITPPIM